MKLNKILKISTDFQSISKTSPLPHIEPVETSHKLSPINFEPIDDINKDIERNTSPQTAVNIDFGNKEGEFLV